MVIGRGRIDGQDERYRGCDDIYVHARSGEISEEEG